MSTNQAKTAIITGATGMVGSIILKQCLESEYIGKVISVSRKNIGIKHDKIREVIHKDFSNFESIASDFEGVDIAYYCIGAYTGAVSDDLFKKITFDFTVSFTNMLHNKSPQASFCFLSGSGADRTEKSRVAFARYKGMAENYLIEKNLKALHIFRPGYIYPVEKRKEPNWMYTLSRYLYPVLKLFGDNFSITSEQLGNAMFQAGVVGATKETLENKDILAFLKSTAVET